MAAAFRYWDSMARRAGFFPPPRAPSANESIGDGEADFLQSGGGLSFGAFVNAGTFNGTMSHRVTSLLNSIVAQK
jgi:hypothetical protein